MKINSIPSSDKVESYQGKAMKPVQKTERAEESDTVEFSDGAKSFSSVIKSVKDKLETQTDAEKNHVEEVAKKIADGTYKVDSSKVAGKILGGRFDGKA